MLMTEFFTELKLVKTFTELNFTELKLEIARFNRLVQSSVFALKNDATALDVLQWLSKHRLCESTTYLFMSLKLYLIVAVSIASCERSFSEQVQNFSQDNNKCKIFPS